MNIDKFKQQHLDILAAIDALRTLARAGVAGQAPAIAAQIVAMSGLIKLHLAVEQRYLYPAVQGSGMASLVRMGHRYETEMDGIAGAYLAFASRWNTALRLEAEPEQFRSEANTVLHALYQRMRREDHELYPAIEAMAPARMAA
ncbi:hemerythrin domain-containing protein [Janthinobacterium aquaticum]|uniref:hemerythrin domain-containing protein n=1 Tax=Janthinobacterium sp. FT58W TaxID=2654254 RepID=UPI0012641343|nr:hemerythrin domain-containing protein [Janthinobacterium sp. FT58W]KAB8038547.1 hemerythrin domain-containing protein [Janthinobacterium sp. FT58W]